MNTLQAHNKHGVIMPFTSENARQYARFKKGESGNPNGAPKGTKHLSTHIKHLLHSKRFIKHIQLADDLSETIKRYEGTPIQAILEVFAIRAIQGDVKAAELLFKYGYGTKLDIDIEAHGEQKLIIETRRAGTTPALEAPRQVIEAEILPPGTTTTPDNN